MRPLEIDKADRTDIDPSDDQAYVTIEKRKVWKTGDRAGGFIPFGLIPLIGLFLLALFAIIPFAHKSVEANAERATQTALAAAGADWAEFDVSGQWVTLKGEAPSKDAAQTAIRQIKRQRGSTFLGKARPVTRVIDRTFLSGGSSPAPVVAPAVDTVQPDEPAIAPAPLDWRFKRDNGFVTLEGLVPDQASKDRVANAAMEIEGIDGILNQLEVSEDVKRPRGFRATLDRGILVMSECPEGTASLSEKVLSVTCLAHPERRASLFTRLSKPLTFGTLGTVDVRALTPTGVCNDTFRQILVGSQIQFATASSLIRQASQGQLAELAEAAKNCPGKLIISGHTDSTGDAQSNVELSHERAQAVKDALVERGVAAQRIEARGFGETRPIMPNDTPQGRARNRRIELEISDTE